MWVTLSLPKPSEVCISCLLTHYSNWHGTDQKHQKAHDASLERSWKVMIICFTELEGTLSWERARERERAQGQAFFWQVSPQPEVPACLWGGGGQMLLPPNVKRFHSESMRCTKRDRVKDIDWTLSLHAGDSADITAVVQREWAVRVCVHAEV